ncbi:hypothetical protein [Mesorhizobium sp. IMUNJ 23232]|uniref:hypothetical protein n=1 Tax=Mesorhizobium sp. IMUNJ 23232 TaxID=3376064 RepID=UPI0037881C18
MLKMIRTVALSALVGLTTLTGMAATAQADGLYLNFGSKADTRVGVYSGDEGPRNVWHRWDRDRWNHDRRDQDRWDRDRWERDGWRHSGWNRGRECTPNRALDKAERLGLRRARIVDVGRRTIDVAGRRYGDRIVLTFARVPGCPIIR